MKEMNISDELLSKFLEGRTDGAEDVRLLQALDAEDLSMEDLAAIVEAVKLVDVEPQQTPDFAKAEEQVKTVLDSIARETIPNVTDRRKSRQRIAWTIAASFAAVLAVALFFLFRPDHNDNNLAQQEKQRIESEAKTQSQSPETTSEQEQSDMIRKNDIPSNKSTEDIQSEPTVAQEEIYSSQKLEKNYASTQIANSLTVTKPSKDDYRVLCKNLEKNLLFEWSATNVQKLHFTVTDSKGKTIAETKDITANQASLKYGGVYPEQKLTWRLIVVFKDGTQDMRSGQVQIDYLSIEK